MSAHAGDSFGSLVRGMPTATLAMEVRRRGCVMISESYLAELEARPAVTEPVAEKQVCPNVYPYDAACLRGCSTQCAAVFDRVEATDDLTEAFTANLSAGHRPGVCPMHGRTTAQHIGDDATGRKVWYCHADSRIGNNQPHDTPLWIED